MLHLREVVRLSALLFAILGSHSTAIPASRNNDPRAITLPTRIEPDGPRLLREVRSTRELPRSTTKSLEPRDWKIEYFDEGWALYFSAYQGFLKIENAAASLENFFVNIADHAAGDWHRTEPLKAFSVKFGELILDFKCEVAEIPWNLVSRVAERIADNVRNGFAGAFEGILSHLTTGGAVYIKMRTSIGAAS